MSVYPDEILDRLRAAKFAGECSDANCSGTSASFECGSFMRFSLRIEPSSKKMDRVVYSTNGCGFAIAAAEVLAETASGRALTEGVGAELFENAISEKLGAFESPRTHCARLATDAFRAALEDFRKTSLDEFSGEKALICTCFGVSEETVEATISGGLGTTVEDIGIRTNAGTGCGSCRFLIAELIDRHEEMR